MFKEHLLIKQKNGWTWYSFHQDILNMICYLLILTTIGEQLGLSFQAWKIISFWHSNIDISRYFHLLCKLLRNEFRFYIKEFFISSNTFYLEVFCFKKKKQLSFGNLFIYFVFKTFNVFLRSLIGIFLSFSLPFLKFTMKP